MADASVQPNALQPYLSESGAVLPDGTEQLIVVKSSGRKAQVMLYEQQESRWVLYAEASGVVGKNGVTPEGREGDPGTPAGLFPLGFAFGTEAIEGLAVEYRQINPQCYWVDDPESPLYNQWVESDTVTWNSAEHLADYPKAYYYCVVIEYNMAPVVPYAGSAIFLHCQTGDYTAGCVAIPETDMVTVLHWLDARKCPMILIL